MGSGDITPGSCVSPKARFDEVANRELPYITPAENRDSIVQPIP